MPSTFDRVDSPGGQLGVDRSPSGPVMPAGRGEKNGLDGWEQMDSRLFRLPGSCAGGRASGFCACGGVAGVCPSIGSDRKQKISAAPYTQQGRGTRCHRFFSKGFFSKH